MMSFITKRFTYANVAVTAALVFAMAGGAFAASNSGHAAKKAKKASYVITSTKQIKPGVIATLKGKTGAAGATGPAGSAGAVGAKGATGATGEKGAEGEPGEKGANGSPGESVTITKLTGPVGVCKEGGAEVANASGKVQVCNGEKGVIHAGETLPANATEVGGYAMQNFRKTFTNITAVKENPTTKAVEVETEQVTVGGTELSTAISFPIPLAAPLNQEHVRYVTTAHEEWAYLPGSPAGTLTKHATPEECLGSYEKPEAEPGYLCVYSGTESISSLQVVPVPLNSAQSTGIIAVLANGAGASPSGAVLITTSSNDGLSYARGSWAVTAV